jgi:hypothetical protein
MGTPFYIDNRVSRQWRLATVFPRFLGDAPFQLACQFTWTSLEILEVFVFPEDKGDI